MKRRILLGFVCVVASMTGLYAQSAAVSVSAGATLIKRGGLGDLTFTDALTLKNGFNIMGRLSINKEGFVGYEFGGGYNRASLDLGSLGKQHMGMVQAFGNALFHFTPDGSRVRPFVAGGGGLTSFSPPGSSTLNGGGVTKFNLNYGFGVKAKVTDKYGFRMDVRDYWTGKPDFGLPNINGKLHNIEVSAGLMLQF